MLIRRIENATRNLGAPPDWDGDLGKCNVLPIRDVQIEDSPFMISAWEPTPAELAALNAGGSIKLWVQGVRHPVVSLTVDNIEEPQC
jgi:hypothetical protein